MDLLGGGKRTRERALPKIFEPHPKELLFCSCRGFLYRKSRTTTPERGGKRIVREGGPKPLFLGPAFGRMDFSRIFIFEPPDFFADFLAGFFCLIFVGKSAQKNPPGKSPGKSSKIYKTKILQHISADCPGVQNPFLGGVSFVRFSSPPLFPPPHGVL